MPNDELHVVTGALSYSGRYIARRLLERGIRVRTLTGHPRPDDPLSAQIETRPLRFDDEEALVRSLDGARVLYNTYWVRFDRGDQTHEQAVSNSRVLFRAARRSGVERVIHVSITQPDETSPLPYFRGKALVEQALVESGMSYTILRPTVLFGVEDILINNIAWLLHRFRLFAVPGNGQYRLQPVYVDDLAALAVEKGSGSANETLDAVGPEILTYDRLVLTIAKAIGQSPHLVHLPPRLVALGGNLLGRLIGDVLITPDEIDGLMAELLVSDQPPTCPTRFSDWLRHNADTLGQRYHSELARHYR